MNIVRAIILAVLLSASACSPEAPSKSDEVRSQIVELASARKKWLAYGGGQQYSFEFERSCFCPFYGRLWHVEVRGTVANFYLVDDREPRSEMERDAWLIPTIPELHDDILRMIERNLSSSATLGVQYHEQFGYPTLVEWNAYPGGDDYLTLRISNVVIGKP